MANSNKVQFGLDQVHYAKVTETVDPTGKVSYSWGEWKDFPGAVNMTVDNVANRAPEYADNVLYHSAVSEPEVDLTFECELVPDDFKKDVLGYLTATDGSLIRQVNNIKSKIAIAYRVKGDSKHRIKYYFVCDVADNDQSASTMTDSVAVQHSTLTLTAYPVEDGAGHVITTGTIDEGATGYAKFFGTALKLPTYSA